MAHMLQTTNLNMFSLMIIIIVLLFYICNLLFRVHLTVNRHYSKLWLGAELAKQHTHTHDTHAQSKPSLKTKGRQFDTFVVTGGTVSCRNVVMTTYGATSDDNVVKLTIFLLFSVLVRNLKIICGGTCLKRPPLTPVLIARWSLTRVKRNMICKYRRHSVWLMRLSLSP